MKCRKGKIEEKERIKEEGGREELKLRMWCWEQSPRHSAELPLGARLRATPVARSSLRGRCYHPTLTGQEPEG